MDTVYETAGKICGALIGFLLAVWSFVRAIRVVRVNTNGARIREMEHQNAVLAALERHDKRLIALEDACEDNVMFRRRTSEALHRIERRLEASLE